jgi:hypothetical protein
VNSYPLDTFVLLQGFFTQEDKVTPLDPAVVTLFVRAPDGTVTSYAGGELTRVAAGNYSFQLTVTTPGPWVYTWQGTGDCEVTSFDTYFQVARSATV